MHTIIKIAVVSVLALFAIVGLVSISKAEQTDTEFCETFAGDLAEALYEQKRRGITCIGDRAYRNGKLIPETDKAESKKIYSLGEPIDDTVKNLGCKTTISRQAEIYDNCIISQMPDNPSYDVRKAVKNKCKRISCNPSFVENLRF